MRDAIGNRQIGLRLHQQHVVGLLAGPCVSCRQINQLDLLPTQPTVDHPAEQHGVHLGEVVSPQDKGIAMVEVVVTVVRLINAISADVPRHRRGHAQPGIRVDVIVAKPPLHEFIGGVAFRNGPLPRAIESELLRRCMNLLGDNGNRFPPGNRDQLSVFPQQWSPQTIFAVEHHPDMITLDAQESFVDIGLAIPGDGNDPVILDADHHMATRATETAGCLVPRDIGDDRQLHSPRRLRRGGKERTPRKSCRGGEGRCLQKRATIRRVRLQHVNHLPWHRSVHWSVDLTQPQIHQS